MKMEEYEKAYKLGKKRVPVPASERQIAYAGGPG